MGILSKYSKEIKNYCNANKIAKLSLFGSYLSNTQSENSDVDLLVEFEKDSDYGLLDIARVERELLQIVGKTVDLHTPDELSRYFRETIVKEARVL